MEVQCHLALHKQCNKFTVWPLSWWFGSERGKRRCAHGCGKAVIEVWGEGRGTIKAVLERDGKGKLRQCEKDGAWEPPHLERDHDVPDLAGTRQLLLLLRQDSRLLREALSQRLHGVMPRQALRHRGLLQGDRPVAPPPGSGPVPHKRRGGGGQGGGLVGGEPAIGFGTSRVVTGSRTMGVVGMMLPPWMRGGGGGGGGGGSGGGRCPPG